MAKKKPSRINVKWELDTTSKATTVKFDAAPKIDYVRNEPKMLGMTSAEYTFNMSGKCSDIHYPAIFWARKPFKVGGKVLQQDWELGSLYKN